MNTGNIIYCIGDSHASFFSGTDQMQPIYPEAGKNLIPLFRSYRLGPVLAYSLPKLETRSRGREKLLALLSEIPSGSRVMLIFGEIDCRVHLLKQAEQRGEPLEKVVKECVDRYFSVVKEVKDKGYQVMLFAVIPSLLKSNIVEPDFVAYGSCADRNKVTKIFNSYLQELATAAGIPVISVFDELVDKDGLTKDTYLTDGLHLSQKVMPLMVGKIRKELPGDLPLFFQPLLKSWNYSGQYLLLWPVSYIRAYLKALDRASNQLKVMLFPYYQEIKKHLPFKSLLKLALGRQAPPSPRYKSRTVRYYAWLYKIDTLLETGTYRGDTVEAVKHSFKKIYSIELGKELYEAAKERFKNDSHIELFNGDSGLLIADLVKRISAPTVYWLDGHYSGGETARGEADTPIMKELEAIVKAKVGRNVILIDDAREFVGRGSYPTIDALRSYFQSTGLDYRLSVRNDIIRIIIK